MDDLFAIFADPDFDLTGQLTVVRLERRAPRVELLLEFRAFSGTFERQAWLLSCAEERLSSLRSEPCYGLELLSDHVLLAPYRDPTVQLGLKGPAENPERAVAALWEAHRAVAGDWFPFDAFLNRGIPLVELLASSAAVVADGPSRITAAYTAALRPHLTDVYPIREVGPVRWVDGGWQPEDPALQLLLLDPKDYIIGKGFSAQRVSSDLLPPVA